jgi:hypothetical protein
LTIGFEEDQRVRISADLNNKYGIIGTLKRKHLNAMPGEEKSPYQ